MRALALALLAACASDPEPSPEAATGPHGAPASTPAAPPAPEAGPGPEPTPAPEAAPRATPDAPADEAPDDTPADDDGRARLLDATARYDDAEGAEMTRRLRAELSVLGAPAPKLTVASWVQGRAPAGGAATVVVFFTPDHPAAAPALEALQALATREAARGLAVVGVTPTKDRAAVVALLGAHGVTFPVALDRGATTTDAYRRSSPVSAVLVVGGKVVWTGNPARVDAALLDKHL